MVNLNVNFLKNRRIGYHTCIPLQDQSKMNRFNQYKWYVAYYVRKNSARNEIHHFWLHFSWISATRCLHSPPTYHHALSKKTMFTFCPNDTSFYALSTKSNDYLNVCGFWWTHLLRIMPIYFPNLRLETVTNRYAST